ncbi:MAG: metallophosphoesterase [Mangrovibacterium sp.]
MRGLSESTACLITGLIIVIDILAYFAMIKNLSLFKKHSNRNRFTFIYFLLFAVYIGLWFFTMARPSAIRNAQNYGLFYVVTAYTTLNLFSKSLVCIGFLIAQLLLKFRQKYASKVIINVSFILSAGLALTIIYGIFIGKRTITTEKVDISFENLPTQLDGTTIIHISDFHLGSFNSTATLNRCAKIINNLNADILVFTGDMVNNFASEMNGLEEPLKHMNAKHGKYAIYGNHDYGDYSNWNTLKDRKQNFIQIGNNIVNAGFTLLDNDNVKIQIKDTCLYLIGVQNWGNEPFPKYADFTKASGNISPTNAFKILLTHDPAHWEHEIVSHTNVSLTLSGHTHGGQLGISFAGITLSPMYFIEHLWNGLYEAGEQKLYVNRGFGCVGFPGRINMPPEITLITLRKKK